MFATVKKWILRGIWDIDALNYEIGIFNREKKRKHQLILSNQSDYGY